MIIMQNSDESRTPQTPETTAANASRRRFLQGAAVATATAAAVTAGGAAIAGASHKDLAHVIQTFGGPQGLISGATCNMCTTNTGTTSTGPFSPISSITAGAGDHQFMLWFWGAGLAAGTYTLSISVSGPGAATFPTPFLYSGSGNNQHNFILANGAAGCPTSTATDTVNHSGSDLAGIASVTLGTGPQDILWQLHLKWGGASISADETFTFTGTVTDSHGNTLQCSVQLLVKKS
jgi:hypothetical protein